MVLFAGNTGLISVLVGWFVTIRLFSLARRTRQEPERLLAVTFGGLFCIGYPMAGASRAPGRIMTNEGARTQAEMVADIQIWALALVAAVFASFTWNAIESIRYWRIMKRRMPLGLAQA